MAPASASAMSVSKSSASNAPATGFHEAHQMEVDSRNPPKREAQISSSSAIASASGHPSVATADFMDKELISPTSRLSRLPPKVPSSPQPSSSNPDKVAISAFQNADTTYTSQDVHLCVNGATSSTSSSATRSFGHPSPLETPVSSFPQPITQHGLNHPIRRPRTSTKVFQSSTDLAAHYGIPQILPPAPRTTSRYLQVPPKQPSAIADFQTLSANYLNMLSKKPTDTTVAASSTPLMSSSSVTAAELEAPVIPSDEITSSQLQNIAEILASSPEFRDQDYFDAYMTSPLMPSLEEDFGVSPSETSYSDFLTTPLFADDAMLTSPSTDYMDMPLFPEYAQQDELTVPAKSGSSNVFDDLLTISPGTPALDSFDTALDPSHIYRSGPSAVPKSAPTPSTSSARRVKATGIRKGVTPETLLDETAPTQPRKYTTPSATSRKELPAVFARKRSRSTAFGEEEDQLGDDLPPNPTEKDLIEAKRRQNTVAARRSRKRKLEQFQRMELSRNEERQLKEQWQERANVLLSLVRTMGVQYPDFPADQLQYADA